jgi:ELWxxDGT repeat protein
MKARYTHLFLILLLGGSASAQIGPAEPAGYYISRVKNINPGNANAWPSYLTDVNGTLFFTADDGVNGQELWKTQGTEATTVLVKNINGAAESSPANLINFNGTLFFSAQESATGRELWKSDGTAAGTVLVKNIHTSGSSDPGWFTICNNILFFVATNATSGRELWKTDGTAAGTVLVKDITPNGNSFDYESVGTFFQVMNNILYFTPGGSAVWRSDGTSAGTYKICDVTYGNSGPVKMLGAAGGKLFLYTIVSDSPHYYFALYTSTGQVAAPLLIKFLANYNFYGYPVAGAGDAMYFSMEGLEHGELWRSDGTFTGTKRVKNINPDGNDEVFQITSYNNKIYFGGKPSVNAVALFQSDGTASGTTVVRNIGPGSLQVSGSKMFFDANDPWISNGTTAGTKKLSAYAVPDLVVVSTDYVTSGSKVYFRAHSPTDGGVELYKYVPCNICPAPTQSPVVTGRLAADEGLQLAAMGNPVTDELRVSVSPVQGAVVLTLTNRDGKMLETRRLEGGSEEIQVFDIRSYPSGMLLLHARTGLETKVLKILKAK